MKFKNIILRTQYVTEHMVEEGLQICYDNISFSTFPYIAYGLKSSKHTLEQYNSGNCIALSLFLKTYFRNMGIHSYLIPASVPTQHMVPGVNHICHVSLLIPYHENKFYIVDPAFYFLAPLDCQIDHNEERSAETMDIHKDVYSQLKYVLTGPDQHNQHNMQCTCYFNEKPQDKWHYYVQEVGLKDADDMIGAVFMKHKPDPFIVKTIIENDRVKKLYHIKKPTPDSCTIIKNGVEIYNGTIKDIPKPLLKELKMKLYKYFNKTLFI